MSEAAASRGARWIPGFRGTCFIVGGLYVVLGAAIVAQGAAVAMAPYGVPAETLASPHYADAIHWVYSHTVVLGLIIALVGALAESERLKLWFSRLILGMQLYYLYLDTVHSDTALGNGLYEGPQSIGPSIIGFFVTLLFLRLSLPGTRR